MLPGVTSVKERLEWILREMYAPDGKPWNPSKLSLAAGLKRPHVGLILKRQSDELTVPTVTKIAAATGVRPAWLLDGEGDPLFAPLPTIAEAPARTTELTARYDPCTTAIQGLVDAGHALVDVLRWTAAAGAALKSTDGHSEAATVPATVGLAGAADAAGAFESAPDFAGAARRPAIDRRSPNPNTAPHPIASAGTRGLFVLAGPEGCAGIPTGRGGIAAAKAGIATIGIHACVPSAHTVAAVSAPERRLATTWSSFHGPVVCPPERTYQPMRGGSGRPAGGRKTEIDSAPLDYTRMPWLHVLPQRAGACWTSRKAPPQCTTPRSCTATAPASR